MFLCDPGFVGVLTSAMGRECAESAGVRAQQARDQPGRHRPPGAAVPTWTPEDESVWPAHKCSRSENVSCKGPGERAWFLRICECSLLRAVIAGVDR